MTVLGIETATERLSAALLVPNNMIYECHESSRSSHCELLTQFIFDLINEADIYIDQIDCIAVSIGPGSFTGLRIGIATGMGLAYGLGIPVIGVNTLMGLALDMAEPGKLVCPVIDAKRSELYTSLYRITDTIPQTLIEPMTVPITQLAEILAGIKEHILITGPATRSTNDILKGNLRRQVSFVPHDSGFPTAQSIAKLGRTLYQAGSGIEPGLLKPIYLRRSDAEIARDTRCSHL